MRTYTVKYSLIAPLLFLFFDIYQTEMCRPVFEPLVVEARRGEDRCRKAMRAARKIVRKYRRREERKEIEKLRRLLPAAGAGQLKRQEVIDQTIDLIVSLEQQLLATIREQNGYPPGMHLVQVVRSMLAAGEVQLPEALAAEGSSPAPSSGP